ncbi:MAG: four helix bundle protein [Planctomycetes bacterium]|nr:four helix bundle protein [Planctomycetota bacterium]
MGFMFENLDVYQKAVDLAERVTTLTSNFPRNYHFLADQLNRASVSVAANIAEGNGRLTKPDRKHFFVIARGSVQECVPLLEIARGKGYITDSDNSEFRSSLVIIAKMISGLINGLDNRKD